MGTYYTVGTVDGMQVPNYTYNDVTSNYVKYATSYCSGSSLNDDQKREQQALIWFPHIGGITESQYNDFLDDSSTYYAGINDGSLYGFPVSHNANGILWLGTHWKAIQSADNNSNTPVGYGGQLGISSNGNIYYRYIDGDNNGNTDDKYYRLQNSVTPWKQLWPPQEVYMKSTTSGTNSVPSGGKKFIICNSLPETKDPNTVYFVI